MPILHDLEKSAREDAEAEWYGKGVGIERARCSRSRSEGRIYLYAGRKMAGQGFSARM